MGSLSEKCSSEGLLGGSFFFSSSSPSSGCRSKKAFVLTLAYQFAQHHPGLKSAIGRVVEKRPEVFQKNLHAQMKLLILGPLQEAHDYTLSTSSKSVIIVDGIDECELEATSIGVFNESDPKVRTQMRSREDDQLEILQVLLQAASNPTFPFRILIASRPERVFRHFFEAGPFAPTLTLDENYNPNADIALFLEAKFAEIRREYKLSPSWPPPHTISTLVKKASGQFIYAATVIRFITESRKHNPYTLLRIALAARLANVHSGLTPNTNLDALYTKILQSSPDPGLSVKWLWVTNGGLSDPASNGLVGEIYEDIYGGLPSRPPAQFINRLLESFDGEAEHLLGDLHSLVKVPSSGDEFKTPYSFHHKSLFDFLGDSNRSGSLFLGYGERSAFFWRKYFDVCRHKGFSDPRREDALHLSFYFSLALRLVDVSSMDPSDLDLPPSNIDCQMASNFNDAHHFVIENNVINNTVVRSAPSSTTSSLKELHSRIAAGAIHDSSERCDAPKCHPETRVAVQDELYSWIVHGDQDQQPKKIKWVTGPAGSGKTAIMGSLAEKCGIEGLLGASFFFSSSSPSSGRHTKTALVLTLAYQLAQNYPGLKSSISRVVEERPEVFKKTLQVQMKLLVLDPLREVGVRDHSSTTSVQKVIIVDGVDECEAGPIFNLDAPDVLDPELGKAQEMRTAMSTRSKEDDQLEILQVLLQASSDPSFPFRILVASRPERTFRQFFEAGPFAPTLTLDEKYNPDADIALFLEAKFSEIRRKYKLSSSWPPPYTIPTLVKNASGQFIYAATVIRFITKSRRHNPYTLLDIVLEAKPTGCHSGSKPFSNLDALYFKILQSSPDPALSIRWLWVINGEFLSSKQDGPIVFHIDIYFAMGTRPPAHFINRWLETFDGEAEHLLGNLHSLLKVPSSGEEFEKPYEFYHKSLFDFLDDPNRSGTLFLGSRACSAFFWKQYFNVCRNQGFTVSRQEDENYLSIYFDIELPAYVESDSDLSPSSIDCAIGTTVEEHAGSGVIRS
ncbi:hypothetical protein EST38_g329 [Candolleomyces aberdarensis]|uniref:Nephrocystin 3-like N-terminal domain-containing protein n=1 Tax=Candolleomyces aberdarensis TaxID=2316362 RepID=A0A4Q2DZP1_9AGAR|nr:hypothetical protein EST38_g329 [Candolleomyces aberdarensis]